MTTTIATATAQAATPATPAARPAKTEVRQPKPLPAPNSDFYEVYETLSAEELATVKRVRAFMEAKVAPVITKYWVDDAFPFELLPAVKELGIGGLGMQGYGCARRKRGAVRLRPNGDCPHRPVVLDVHGRARRPGDGLHLHRRIGRAEAEVAAADGALRKDRLLRPHRAARGFRRVRRPADDGEARGRHLDPQRREAVDRQRSVVRCFHHLGARCRRQPGQGLHRREQDDARLQRREDREQDRAQGGPERPHHAEGLPRAGGEPPPGRQLVPRHREGA